MFPMSSGSGFGFGPVTSATFNISRIIARAYDDTSWWWWSRLFGYLSVQLKFSIITPLARSEYSPVVHFGRLLVPFHSWNLSWNCNTNIQHAGCQQESGWYPRLRWSFSFTYHHVSVSVYDRDAVHTSWRLVFFLFCSSRFYFFSLRAPYLFLPHKLPWKLKSCQFRFFRLPQTKNCWKMYDILLVSNQFDDFFLSFISFVSTTPRRNKIMHEKWSYNKKNVAFKKIQQNRTKKPVGPS